jgi:hypothetical protein
MLTLYATSLRVTGLIPSEVIGSFLNVSNPIGIHGLLPFTSCMDLALEQQGKNIDVSRNRAMGKIYHTKGGRNYGRMKKIAQ